MFRLRKKELEEMQTKTAIEGEGIAKVLLKGYQIKELNERQYIEELF